MPKIEQVVYKHGMFRRYSSVGYCIYLSIPLAILVSLLFYTFSLPIIEADTRQLPVYKCTFVSVLLVLGVFQYNLFFDIAERFRKALDDEDFGPIWGEYIETAKRKAESIFQQPNHPGVVQWQAELEFMSKEIDDLILWYRDELRSIVWQACVRFVVIFGIGFALLISLALDILRLLKILPPWETAELSQSFLLGSLTLFAALFFLFMFAFGHELSDRMSHARPPNIV